MRFRFSKANAIAFLFLALFLVANRGAYEGYFSDDDLDNLANTKFAGIALFGKGFGSFAYDPFNFRPVGHLTFRWMAELWGLRFEPYVGLIQILHTLNAFLVFRITRSLLSNEAGVIAALFFAFHPALIAAHWKPMYLFDVLCGTALIGAYSCYRKNYWLASLLLFWCGYKSKEIAIFFPLLLVADEWWGRREWLRVLPFLGISVSFGGQAVLFNRDRDAGSPYALHFTKTAVWQCLQYYGRASLGIPWVFLAGLPWISDRARRWVGGSALAAAILLGPLLFLPGRLFSVYLYVPLLFGAIAVGGILANFSRPVLLLLMVSYFAFGLRELRTFRKFELTQARVNRDFVESACKVLKGQRHLSAASYDGSPSGLNTWGLVAGYRLCSNNLAMNLRPWSIKSLELDEPVIRWIKWPGRKGRVQLTRFDGDLTGEWYGWEESFRWMGERAGVLLKVHTGDRQVVLDLIAARAEEIEARINGKTLGTRRLNGQGPQQVSFPLPLGTVEGRAVAEFWARPAKRLDGDPRVLGLAVRSIASTP